MSKGDPYKILGVSEDADEAEIRSAYRTLAKKYHPDMGEGSSDEKFRAIQNAYEILSDPEKRKAYSRDQPKTVRIEFTHQRQKYYEPPRYAWRSYENDAGHIDLRNLRFGMYAESTRVTQIDDVWRRLISLLFE